VIDAMQLKDVLRQIDTKYADLFDSRKALLVELPAIRRQPAGAVHPIKWKAKYGGMEVADAKRLKGLEDENRRLKKLLAEAMLDNAALKDILGKNV
jgi:hypothetical protein